MFSLNLSPRAQIQRLQRTSRSARRRRKATESHTEVEAVEARLLLTADVADSLYNASVLDAYGDDPQSSSFLVKFDRSKRKSNIEDRTGADATKSSLIPYAFYLEYPNDVSFEDVLETYEEINGFEYFHPTSTRELFTRAIPNDPLFAEQWHLNNTGQEAGGLAGEDINVVDVWDDYRGEGVLIAILDDGLELGHEDFVDNIVPGSFDYSDNDNDPSPEANSGDHHGTSVAGLAGAVGDLSLIHI